MLNVKLTTKMHWMWKKFHIVKKFLCEKHTCDKCVKKLNLILKCYKCDEMKKSNKIKLAHNIVTYTQLSQ